MKVEEYELRAVQRAIKMNSAWIREALAAALYAEGLAIMAKSVRLVPVDTGMLRGSHFVAPPVNKTHPAVVLGYGVDYGVYVHERPDLKHKPPTQYRFLRTPLENASSGYKDRLAKRTAQYWASGKKMAINSTTPKDPTEAWVAGMGARAKKAAKKKAKKRKGKR